jgi:hypothetical protein
MYGFEEPVTYLHTGGARLSTTGNTSIGSYIPTVAGHVRIVEDPSVKQGGNGFTGVSPLKKTKAEYNLFLKVLTCVAEFLPLLVVSSTKTLSTKTVQFGIRLIGFYWCFFHLLCVSTKLEVYDSQFVYITKTVLRDIICC